MSRQFLNVPNKPYIGAPFNAPIAFCEPSKMTPLSVPFNIVWLTYGAGSALPNVSVEVNMSQQGQTVVIDKIRSVYIDNLGNNVPVYVYFPSTNYTVPCQPNSAGWFNVLTNDLRAFIIGQGFTDADSGAQTVVAFSNIQPPPYTNIELDQSVSLWRASPAIQRGNTIYNSKYAPPALGDQTVQKAIALTSLNTVNLFPLQTRGFYIINSIQVNTLGINTSVNTTFDLFVESTGVSGTLYDFVLSLGAGQSIFYPYICYNFFGANIKIDATQQWRLRNNGVFNVSGGAFVVVNFTYIPVD